MLRRLWRDEGGNMVLIVAGMLVTIVALGFGVDYGRAAGLQSRLAAAGHAAAMAAVSPALMGEDDATAQAQAGALFVHQVSGLSGLVFDGKAGVTVTLAAPADGSSGRVAVVRWNAAYATVFGGLFGAGSLPLAGSAQASAAGAPHIDFTVLSLAASSAQSIGARGYGDQGFGDQGAGGALSAYDALLQAAQALVPLAQQMAGRSGVIYRMDIVSADTAAATGGSGGGANGGGGWLSLASLFGGLSDVSQLGFGNGAGADNGGGNGGDGNGGADNGLIRADAGSGRCLPLLPCPAAGSGRGPASSLAGGPGAAASYGAALSALAAATSVPGDGARVSGAQGVIVLATDGSLGAPGADDLATCAAIRSRGIVIAVFYAPTTAATGQQGGWFDNAPWGGSLFGDGGDAGPAAGEAAGDAVATGLRSCASPQAGGTALFLQQGAGQTTGDALAALFAMAAGNAHLVH